MNQDGLRDISGFISSIFVIERDMQNTNLHTVQLFSITLTRFGLESNAQLLGLLLIKYLMDSV